MRLILQLHDQRQMVAITTKVSRTKIGAIRLLATILLVILQEEWQVAYHTALLSRCQGWAA